MELWFLSDPHFGHSNILNFKSADGSPMRYFKSVEEMDETIVQNWNKVVKTNDHIYIMGDVALMRRYIGTIKRCAGHKRLILGNHDIFSYKDYIQAGFEKIFGSRVLDNILFTHIPVHPGSVGRFKANVHGSHALKWKPSRDN